MQIIPTQDEVLELLKRTGALRDGFFKYPDGVYSNQHLDVALAMTSFEAQKILSVGLSRLVRANPEIRAIIDQLSIVTPATGGIAVAFTVCEALRAKRVYWAERQNEDEPMRFAQFLTIEPGEKVLLVDDRLRSGKAMSELKALAESHGAEVVGIAVIVHQPEPVHVNFDPLPFYHLVRIDAQFCTDEKECSIAPGQKPVEIWEG
jgi:orotate phosphoribosyltransferase